MQSLSLPSVSTREDFDLSLSVIDDENGQPITFTNDDAVVFCVRDNVGCAVLNGTLATGEITIIDGTVLRVQFPRATMTTIAPCQYSAGATMERDGETSQLFVGMIQIVDGIVPK